MQIDKEIKLDFDDVTLISHEISKISSRDNIDTYQEFGGKQLRCPIMASPMKDVCNNEIAKIMQYYGGLGILHRFNSIEEQISEFQKSKAPCAIGINGDHEQRFERLYKAGNRIFCLDVANGANINVVNTATELANKYNDVSLIVGNVVSDSQFKSLMLLPNIIGIRVGVAGGSVCTTKNATAIYQPMISLISSCYKEKQSYKNKVKLIADGGIKGPSDFCKAIAAGADFCMVGSIIANTKESPAELIKNNVDNKLYKVYHGSASFEIQKLYKKEPKYIEGKTKLLEYSDEPLTKVLDRFMEGLRSCMSYFNAHNLEELREKAVFGVVK